MPPIVRCLPLLNESGPVQMAADEVLLESAIAGVATLRFYTWREPTQSLGYFQPTAERRAGLPWVRRTSGGAALVHHHELTYALALPPGSPWQKRGESWICRMHTIIGQALQRLGVPLHPVRCETEVKVGPVLCFLHHTPGDLLLAGRKIVGSAQRKSRGALMQHGGILLAQSPFTPELPGIRDLVGLELTPNELAQAIAEDFQADTGWELRAESWTELELRRRTELAESKYSRPEWNEKR
ncbi:MAG: lipoate--protein ligase family protein [Gemmataceae bacterium]|nr:lipoate--protein ligase family protein [Gemmataceae bacterium]